MANNNTLKSDIRQYIYSNQNEEITGNILRDVLLEMVDILGDGWTYKGVATTTTNPGTPDDNVFYIATAPGTYTNFGGLSVADGEVAILKYNGSWAKDVTGAATSAQLTQLGQDVEDVIEGVAKNYENGYLYRNERIEPSETDIVSDFVPCEQGDTLIWYNGYSETHSDRYIGFFKADRSPLESAYYVANSVPSRTITVAGGGQIAFVRASFAKNSASAYISINGQKVWERNEGTEGIKPKLDGIAELLDVNKTEGTINVTPFASAWKAGYYVDSLSNFVSSSTAKTFLLEVIPGDVYRVEGKRTSSNYRLFDANGIEIKKNGGAYFQSAMNGDFQMPTNAKYFQINCVLSSENISLIYVYHYTTEYASPVLSEALIDKEGITFSSGYVNGNSNGVFEESTGSQVATTYIPLSGAKYVRFLGNKPNIDNSDVGYAFYDKDKNCVESWVFPYDTTQAQPSTQEVFRRIPENAEFFSTSIYTTQMQDFYLKLGMETVQNVPELVRKNIVEKAQFYAHRYSDCHDFGSQPAADGSNGSFCNVLTGSYSDLLTAVYDPLVSAYPDYVTKHNIGKDASGTYDMFAYVFTPKYYQQTIILTSGVHAVEVSSIASLARIMQLVANSDGTEADIDFLRYNVRFVVVPVVNVWGFSQSPKNNYNSNGAAMQGWNQSPKIQELQNIETFLADYINEASFLIDMHTTTSANYPDFYGIINQDAPNVRTILRTASWLGGHYTGRSRTLSGWEGYVPIGLRKIDNHTLNQYANNVWNVPASTMELTDYIWDGANTGTQATANIVTMGVTMYLNYIIQQLNDTYRFVSTIPSSDYGKTKG